MFGVEDEVRLLGRLQVDLHHEGAAQQVAAQPVEAQRLQVPPQHRRIPVHLLQLQATSPLVSSSARQHPMAALL